MNPSESQHSRRDLAVTYFLLGLCLTGTISCMFGIWRLASIAWAIAAGTLLCLNTGVYPHTLFWRLLRRAVGHKYDTRFRWGELCLHRPYFDIGFRVSERGHDDGNHDMLIVAFVFGSLYVFLPTRVCRYFKDETIKSVSEESDYGFYTIDSSIVWRWNRGYYSWQIPFFSFKHFSTEVLSIDGKRTVYIELSSDKSTIHDWYERKKAATAANCEVHPYTYVRRNGEIQHRMATVFIDRMTWTRKWFPFLKMVRTCIDVDFNEEIGEEVGTWKGGTTGCGYQMLRGEKPVDTLRRMERERKFERGHREPRKSSTIRRFLARLFGP